MKIYKLDIDAAQPTNQVVQMQQNTAGVLSVNVTKNGDYIRNLSCQMFDGETEISACSAGDKGFKLDIGDTPKHYTVKATATPIECSNEYIASYASGTRVFPFTLNVLQLKAGTYKQDEFLNIVDKFGGIMGSIISLSAASGSDHSLYANFDSIFMQKVAGVGQTLTFRFNDSSLPSDATLSVFQDCVFTKNQSVKTSNKNTVVISSDTYPAVGYYVNYQADTLVKPSPNANAFSEIDILPTEAGFQTLSADSFTTESFTLSGVTYVPTTLSVDGVEYTVLAAPVETPSETVEG